MRKALIAGGAVAATVAAVVLIASGGNGDGGYVVRAIFDSGGFMVQGEEVRIAGANAGKVDSVDVTMPGETAAYEDGRPEAIPGKAVIVMRIADPGFQDFRSDATCVIRPQSLIGEKFVDCRPTLPRAPGSPPPPPLKQIPSGQPGAGQYLLPLGNNSTSVDPDLVISTLRLPYAQRLRLILNDLGAGLAGRGEDLEEIVKRANPVLRDVDRLLGILAAQRKQLTKLAVDSEQILGPLSRERAHVAGFISNSGAVAEASSERGAELEATLRKLPEFLRQFRFTMHSLQGFSDAATPVLSDLGKAAPSLTDATRTLTPFSAAATVALKSLGATGEVAGPKLRAADPVVRKTRDLARSGASPTTKLAKFLVSTKKTGGWDGLVDLIYNATASFNGFDQYGHFVRGLVTLTNCVDYVTSPQSGCVANFTGVGARISANTSAADLYRLMLELQAEQAEQGGGTSAGATPPAPAPTPPADATPVDPSLDEGEQLGAEAPLSQPQRALLDYLLGR